MGFKLPEIDAACIKVERNYKDLINNTIIEINSEFVEKLTHDSFIVQVEKITDRYQTRLDKLLSVFEQKNFIDNSKITKQFKHETDLEEVKIITDILHYTGTDPVEKKQIENQQEAWRTVDAIVEDLKKVINEKDKEIEELKRKLKLGEK